MWDRPPRVSGLHNSGPSGQRMLTFESSAPNNSGSFTLLYLVRITIVFSEAIFSPPS